LAACWHDATPTPTSALSPSVSYVLYRLCLAGGRELSKYVLGVEVAPFVDCGSMGEADGWRSISRATPTLILHRYLLLII
jgi:hypothetical protein